MKPIKKSFVKFLKSRARWNHKIQANAIADEDIHLIANTSVLGELCALFLNFKKPIHFIDTDVSELLENEPELFFEYLSLKKKYNASVFEEQYKDLVQTYRKLLNNMFRGNPSFETFRLIKTLHLSCDNAKNIVIKPMAEVTADMIIEQPKEAVETVVQIIFYQTNFGLSKAVSISEDCVEALETAMIEASKTYDFVYVAKILRALAYLNAPKSKCVKKALRFLRNFKPRKQNLQLQIVTDRGTEQIDSDTEMVRFNKEIVLAVLEWKTEFRMYRDFGNL